MDLMPELNEQIKHYASQLNKTEEDVNRELDEFLKQNPAITNRALAAHLWGTGKGISLPMRTIIPTASEPFYLIQNLTDLAKKGTKTVNIRGYVISELASKKGNPKVVLADESGIVQVLVQDKNKWVALGIKQFDPLYVESLSIWQPNPLEDRFVYNIGMYSSVSRVKDNNHELKMPTTSDIKATPINSLKEKDKFVFLNGWITGTRNTKYLSCSNCRKKTTVAEGESFTCTKCNNQAVSKQNTIKQVVISDNSGGSIIGVLPPDMNDVNTDLLKGAQVGVVGNTDQREGREELGFRITAMLHSKEAKVLDQQYKNAANIAIKYVAIQPNETVERKIFTSFLNERFPSLNADELTVFMIRNSFINENGTFLSKKQ